MPPTATLDQLMATLGANQHAYAQGCEHMQDAFNKHLLRQLAHKRLRPLAELNRAILITGGIPYTVATTDPRTFRSAPIDPVDDRTLLLSLERNEEHTRGLYAELLGDDRLPLGMRRLLEEQLRATTAVLVIIGEAIRNGAQRAA
ncbi:MAG: hypothetical protein ACO1NQ_13795 [Flavobacteriales bacterium]